MMLHIKVNCLGDNNLLIYKFYKNNIQIIILNNTIKNYCFTKNINNYIINYI